MSVPPSQVRLTLKRQLGLILGALQLLWLGAGVFVAFLLGHWWIGVLPLGLSLIVWRTGVRAVDQLVGLTLDRLAAVAEQTAPLDPKTGGRLPALVADTPQGALRQLVERLAEAQEGLSMKVKQLELANQELAGARDQLVRAERLAVVGRLSAGVAHEIGNPLGALVGFVGVARGASDPAVVQEALSGIAVQADRIHRTVQELMDFARAGKMELGPVPLPSATAAASRLVKAHPRWRAMRLAVELPGNLPEVRASEHHLVQVLVNLLLNAADVCAGCGVVAVVGERTPDGKVRLLVSDDGPGIAAGDEERIFEPFVSTKPVGEGTGLGLAISRQLVEAFGGALKVAAAPKGASFDLRLEPWEIL